jgi:hypothetical protein
MYLSTGDALSLESLGTTDLDVQQAYVVWTAAARQVWLKIFAPNDRYDSILRPSLIANNVDSFYISYDGTDLVHLFPLIVDYLPEPSASNTPASGESWYVGVGWTLNTESALQVDTIYFLPTLGVDTAKTGATLNTVNTLLNSTIQLLNNKFANPAGIQVDMWKLINWMYVVQYWSLLYDVGQMQPTIYPRNGGFPTDYNNPQNFPDTNNIFINNTLFRIYAQYFQNTIVPLLQPSDAPAWSFQDLSSTNSIPPVEVAFYLQYSCTQKQIKTALSLVISIIIADYTFLNPTLGLIILYGAWRAKRTNKVDGTLSLAVQLTTGNWCEGCVARHANGV